MLASKPSQQVESDSRPFGNPSDSVKADRALRLRNSQSGGFNLSSFGLNIGSRSTQINKVGSVAPGADKETKRDWIGLAIAALGLLTALVGWRKG